MIKFTMHDTESTQGLRNIPVSIRPEHIVSVMPEWRKMFPGATHIRTVVDTEDDNGYSVRESYEDVMAAIEHAAKPEGSTR